ncbi:MAG: VOC family protein [Actinobacteria bacterium]|nr:VOC family protein [Actinomycetota bacterium]
MSAIPAQINQVTLAVKDIDSSAAFYADGFGFTELIVEGDENPLIRRFDLGAVTLTLISRELLLSEMHLDSFPDAPGPVTLAVVIGRDEVDHYVDSAERAGATVIAPAEDKPSGPRIGFVADPDGHVWELIAP